MYHGKSPFFTILGPFPSILMQNPSFLRGAKNAPNNLRGVQEKVRQKAEGSEEDFDLVPLVIMQMLQLKNKKDVDIEQFSTPGKPVEFGFVFLVFLTFCFVLQMLHGQLWTKSAIPQLAAFYVSFALFSFNRSFVFFPDLSTINRIFLQEGAMMMSYDFE